MKAWIVFVCLSIVLLFLLTACNLIQASAPVNNSRILVITQTADSVENSFIHISDPVMEHVDQIIKVGKSRNNQANVFSKVGDSITVSRGFLYSFGTSSYDLGPHDYLDTVIDFYKAGTARTSNSFANQSLAAGEGWAAWGVLNPDLADTHLCVSGESPLVCEYRIVRPAVALIMFGTNDVGYRTGGQFRSDMSQIVNISIEMGIVPILSTIPNRPDISQRVDMFNNIIRDIAQEQRLPLIDYYTLTQYLPNYGLTSDNVHPSVPSMGYEGTAIFSDSNLRYGYTVRNLASLQALYSILAYLTAS
jgi:hypothetical protein